MAFRLFAVPRRSLRECRFAAPALQNAPPPIDPSRVRTGEPMEGAPGDHLLLVHTFNRWNALPPSARAAFCTQHYLNQSVLVGIRHAREQLLALMLQELCAGVPRVCALREFVLELFGIIWEILDFLLDFLL